MPENTRKAFVFFLLMTLLCHTIYSQSEDYPFVHEEEFHQPIFENDQIRVLNVRASYGDTTAFHRHCNPILYVAIEGTTVSLKEPTNSWKKAELPKGWIGQDIFQSDSCFVHRFAIPVEGRLHIIAVEALKNTDEISLSSAPIHREEGFSVYKIELPQLGEIDQISIPIIMVESSCKGECKVEVIDSNKLSKELLQKQKAFVVFFENPDLELNE